MKTIYTAAEVGQILKVSTQTVRNYIKKGLLKSFRLKKERGFKIKGEELKKFIETQLPILVKRLESSKIIKRKCIKKKKNRRNIFSKIKRVFRVSR